MDVGGVPVGADGRRPGRSSAGLGVGRARRPGRRCRPGRRIWRSSSRASRRRPDPPPCPPGRRGESSPVVRGLAARGCDVRGGRRSGHVHPGRRRPRAPQRRHRALSIQAVFPTTRIWMRTWNAIPRPARPRPPGDGVTYDVRTGEVVPERATGHVGVTDGARIQARLARGFDPAELRRIKRLWVRHSIAEDRRDIDGLIATLAPGRRLRDRRHRPALGRPRRARGRSTRSCSRPSPTTRSPCPRSSSGPRACSRSATLTGTNQGPWAGVPAGAACAVALEVLILFPWDPGTERFTGERIWFESRRGSRRRFRP